MPDQMPVRPKRRPFGGAGAVAIVFVTLSIGQLASLVVLAVALLVVLAGGADLVTALNTLTASPAFLPLAAIPTSCALVVVSVVVARLYGLPFARAVAWAMPRPLPAFVSLVFVFCAAVVSSFVVETFRARFPGFTLGVLDVVAESLARPGLASRAAAVVAIAVFPPIAEELMFRGVILGSVRARRGPVFAVVCSSLLFGFMHVEPLQILNGFFIGLALGVATWRTGSVLPAILGHAINNGVACYAAFSDRELETPWFVVIVAAVLLVPAGVLLFRITSRPASLLGAGNAASA